MPRVPVRPPACLRSLRLAHDHPLHHLLDMALNVCEKSW